MIRLDHQPYGVSVLIPAVFLDADARGEFSAVQLPKAADLAGTLAALAAIGYREVELAGLHERTAREFADLLEENGITANKNGVPGDTRGFVETSGVRIGVAAETTRGHDEKWFKELAERMIVLLRTTK